MKLLFLTSRFPFPVEKGDKLRAYYFIKFLSRYHDIYLFAINDKDPSGDSLNEVAQFCKAIHVETINTLESVGQMVSAIKSELPFQVAYFTRAKSKKNLQSFVDRHKPDMVFCHLIRMSEYAKVIKEIPSVIDYMDAFSKGVERLIHESAIWKRIPLKLEEKRLKEYEVKVFKHFKQHFIISGQDRLFIRHPSNSSINVIPNGVDFQYYHSANDEKKYDLLFVGNMAYEPNIKSVVFASKKILPLLRKQVPGINFMIAGASPVKQVRNLASETITVSGWMEDVRKVFWQSRIMIAPMVISIGLQNKILQAMAMKVPCVISQLANNAINAPDDCVCVAETPDQFTRHIIDLLNNPAKGQAMAERAYAFIRNNFDWELNVEKLNRVLTL